jgi:hypothetical protein
MQHIKRPLILILLVLAALLLVACGEEDEPESVKPAQVEEIEGSEFNLVTLTERAAERLDIQSVQVIEEEIDGNMHKVIPYSAVIYGLNGETWAYINPEPLAFMRHPITIDFIEGGQAFLFDGPPVDTSIVTVGAQLLYGTDTGVGR